MNLCDDATGPRRMGRRQVLAGTVALALAAGSPQLTAGSRIPAAAESSSSLLGEMLALVPEEAVPSPSTWVDFFLPGVTLDALWPRMDLDLAFAPNPHSLDFNSMPDSDQLREMLAATPMAVEGFLRAGDLMLIRGAFDRVPVQEAWSALGYVPGDDPNIFEFRPGDPDRALDELWELHDRLNLPGRYGMWSYLCLLEDDTIFAVDDPALIDAMRRYRSLVDVPVGAAALRSLAEADTSELSMGRIRFGDQLPARSRRPSRAGDRSERIDQRNDDALAVIADEIGPLPAIVSMLAGTTPGMPWVDDVVEPASPSATYVALIEPEDRNAAGEVVEIVRRRFESTLSVRHEAPFTELLTLGRAVVDEANGLARLEFSQVGSKRYDLEYLLWYEDAPFLYTDPA